MMQFYLDTNQLLFASACSSYVLSLSLSSFLEDFKCLWTHGHLRLPPTASLLYFALCFVHRGRFQPWFFWRQDVSCCQYACCFSPASHGTVSGESHFPRSSVYLCYVIWVGTAWWTAGCHMFLQNLSVSRSFPVAGCEQQQLGLSVIVGWITWTGLFDVKVTIHSANVWPSIILWISFSDLVLRAGFILTFNNRY